MAEPVDAYCSISVPDTLQGPDHKMLAKGEIRG